MWYSVISLGNVFSGEKCRKLELHFTVGEQMGTGVLRKAGETERSFGLQSRRKELNAY